MVEPCGGQHDSVIPAGVAQTLANRHVLRLPGLARTLPAFHVGTDVGVLPAFSAFTGGVGIRPGVAGRVIGCAGDFLVEAGRPVA